MERLTEKRDGQNVIPLRQDGKIKWTLSSAGMGNAPTKFLYGVHADKLAEYEDIEERLQNVYGEHDGLLSEVVNGLERHEKIDLLQQPIKSRLLTDEDVDRWEEYKSLENEGKLLKLPCKIGDMIFAIPSKVNYKLNVLTRYEELNRVCKLIVNRIEISEYGYLLSVCDGMANVLERSFGETWFLTREEAETALKKLEDAWKELEG